MQPLLECLGCETSTVRRQEREKHDCRDDKAMSVIKCVKTSRFCWIISSRKLIIHVKLNLFDLNLQLKCSNDLFLKQITFSRHLFNMIAMMFATWISRSLLDLPHECTLASFSAAGMSVHMCGFFCPSRCRSGVS